MMESFTFLSEARDRRAGGKTYLTQQNAPRLCEALAHTREYREQLGTEHIEAMSRLAPLYDIGKAGIPDGVLVKSGKLSPAEFSMIKKHTSYGEEVIDRARERAGVKEDNLLQLARDIVASHHERWDGLGYPLGIGGQDIPLSGRIIAIVDVYEALITSRPYRRAITHEEAVQIIREGSGCQFDPAVVDVFLEVEGKWKAMSEEGREIWSPQFS